MMRFSGIAFFVLCFFTGVTSFGQEIFLDESYDDWSDEELLLEDTGDPYLGFDVEQLYVANDQEYLFIRLVFNQEVQLQDGSNVAIRIDLDNNPNTGFTVNGIGADLTFFLGTRSGFLNTNTSSININHEDIGLVVSPTVSSDQFEIAIRRNNSFAGIDFNMLDEISIRIEQNGNIGDQLPNNNGGVSYSIDNNVNSSLYHSSLTKSQDTEYRLVSYNVKRDQLFESDRFDAYRNILKSSNPDIIAFQEIYNHTASETRSLVAEMLGDDISEWYTEKQGSDIILLSKFPIVFEDFVAGNGAFVIDLGEEEILLINAHLPCCENDTGRLGEIDEILAYIRDIQDGTGDYALRTGSPIIFCGDMNLVGFRDQLDNIVEGNIDNNNAYGPDLSENGADFFVDSKAKTSGLPFSFTWFNGGSSFFPGRLDFVFYTPELIRAENSYSLNTPSLAQDQLQDLQIEENDSRVASDHCPMIFDFRFPNTVSNSIEDAGNDAINIYPNPSSNKLYIDHAGITLRDIKLYDLMGRLILDIPTNAPSTGVDISSLQKGIYVMKCTLLNNKYIQKKLIVQ